MNMLKDLEGLSVKEIECDFINKPSDIRKLLKAGKAATAADVNGALNIWMDDKGFIRCEAMAFMRSLEKRQFKKFKETEKWIAKWLIKIK
jgi:hypothetical protein